MASVSFVEGKWRALVRLKGRTPKSKRFATERAARKWGRETEDKMLAEGPAARLGSTETVGQIIERYKKLRGKTRPIKDTSTEHYTLKQLKKNLGDQVAATLTVDNLVAWALERRDDGAGPYTINMDLSRLGTVFRYAGSGIPDVIGAARPKLSYLGLIGGGNLRERRPTEDEFARLLDWMTEHKGEKFAEFMRFAAITAMRRGEIAALKWDDLNPDDKVVQVQRKHPRKGKVLEVVPLLGDSWDIANRQPKDGELVFNVGDQTMSKYFTEGCRALSIPDLHLHDLRHEGVSQMIEDGFSIPEAAVVSGHKDWRHLKRYTQIKPESLHARALRRNTPPSPDSRNTADHPDRSGS